MKKIILICLFASLYLVTFAQQRPCSDPAYRQFDFWVGEWEAFGAKGKAGDSKISMILDSCIILEEWTSANVSLGVRYAGKSFNTYNQTTGQWQQTWVDNIGGSTEYLRGESGKDKITFYADHVKSSAGNEFMRKLTFYKLSIDKVRQHGERSDDGGKTWTTEYDLEYRRKK